MYRFMLLCLQHYKVNKKGTEPKTKHCNNMAPTLNNCAVETQECVMCVFCSYMLLSVRKNLEQLRNLATMNITRTSF